MAKSRKTRKEKLSSDTRRMVISEQRTTSPSSSSLFSLSETPHHTLTTSQTTIGTSHYTYLRQDLLKITILTISVIIAELILKFVIKI